MNESLVQRFIGLIEYDQRINALERKIAVYRHDIVSFEQELQSKKNAFTQADTLLHAKKLQVQKYEHAMIDIESREHIARKRLEGSKNNREYEAFEHELKAIRASELEMEQQILASWKQVEDAQIEYNKISLELVQQEQNLAQMHEELHKKIEAVSDEITSLLTNRASKTIDIEKQLLERYTTMRSTLSNPAVPLENDSCTACFYNIPQQEAIAIKRGGLRQCKMCFRFLYNPALAV